MSIKPTRPLWVLPLAVVPIVHAPDAAALPLHDPPLWSVRVPTPTPIPSPTPTPIRHVDTMPAHQIPWLLTGSLVLAVTLVAATVVCALASKRGGWARGHQPAFRDRGVAKTTASTTAAPDTNKIPASRPTREGTERVNMPQAPAQQPRTNDPTDPAEGRLLKRIAELYEAIDQVPSHLVEDVLFRIQHDKITSGLILPVSPAAPEPPALEALPAKALPDR
jgi:hypothetical protein